MAVCCTLYVTVLALVTLAPGSAGSGVEWLVEEDTLDVRVEPLVGNHNTSSSSGAYICG